MGPKRVSKIAKHGDRRTASGSVQRRSVDKKMKKESNDEDESIAAEFKQEPSDDDHSDVDTTIPDASSMDTLTPRKSTPQDFKPIKTKKKQPKKEPKNDETNVLDPSSLPTPSLNSQDLRMSYRIARGEQGVLTFEPYKSILLPYWRFKTVPIAQNSSRNLKAAFDHYVSARDLPGADMARKFIQMGMTRAKRYANHKGGRKYDRTEREVERDGGTRTELPKSEGHEGRDEKLAASEVFKAVWRSCIADEEYLALKEGFVREQKAWDRGQKGKVKKEEVVDDDDGG